MSDDFVDDQDAEDWDDIDTDDADPGENLKPSVETEDAEAAVAEKPEEVPEPQVELDPEDPIEFPDQFYDVQEEYEYEGRTVQVGTSVQIKCANCAAWEAPLQARGGKPLCRPGQSFGLPVKVGEEPKKWRMQANRYSCQTHFIPKDMDDVLTLLTDDADQVKMLMWTFPTIVKLVKLVKRVQQHHEKNGGDPEVSLNHVIDFLLLFRSEQQHDLVKPFIKMVSKQLSTKKPKAPARRKDSFKSGDSVSWDIPGTGKRAEGFILTIGGRGNLVTIMVTGESIKLLNPDATQPAVKWRRPVQEWKDMNPRIELTAPLVTEE